MLWFNQLWKKVKRKFFKEKIDFELRIALGSDSQDVDLKHVKKNYWQQYWVRLETNRFKIDRMLFDAKTRMSLIRNFKLNELEILGRSDEYFIILYYCLFFNIYVVSSQSIWTFKTSRERYITIASHEQRYLRNYKLKLFTRRCSKTSKRSINLL